MKPTLLIIDVQNDYFEGGKMELPKMDDACQNIQKLISHFRANGNPIIFIQHLAKRPGATFFIPGTHGALIHSSVQPKENEPIITKHYPNSFRETSLQGYLQQSQLDELVICGAMSHMCIDTTTRAAFDLGYSCTLIADACATRDLNFAGQKVKAEDVQLAYMAALSGTFAQVLNTEIYLGL